MPLNVYYFLSYETIKIFSFLYSFLYSTWKPPFITQLGLGCKTELFSLLSHVMIVCLVVFFYGVRGYFFCFPVISLGKWLGGFVASQTQICLLREWLRDHSHVSVVKMVCIFVLRKHALSLLTEYHWFTCSEGGSVFPSSHNYLLVRSQREKAGKLPCPTHLRKVWATTF